MAAVLLVTTSNRSLNAQECTVTHDVVSGDQVPCTGVLWTIDATEEALTLKAVTLPKLKVDLEHLRELRILDGKRHGETLQACHGELRETRGLLTQAMGLSATPWYKEPVVVAGISFISGLVLASVVYRGL